MIDKHILILNEILGFNIKSIDFIDDINTVIMALDNNEDFSVNIYELAHRECKEWAVHNGYVLESGDSWCNIWKLPMYEDSEVLHSEYDDSEIDSILTACNWIKENR